MDTLNQSEHNSLFEISEITISYKTKGEPKCQPIINNSKDAFMVLKQNWSNNIELLEEFNALFLNRANKLKGIFRISKGGVCFTVIDPKILFSAALKTMTCKIILSHNHPSGNISPSNKDKEITKQLVSAGKLLDIVVEDHIILSPFDEYYSFSDSGLL